MKTRTLHRALSMLLTAAMVLNIGLTPVFATEGTTPPSISGVCTHHTEHKEDCGYQQGTPCTHEHTDDCSTKELTCALIEGDAPKIATDSEADIDSDAVVDSGNVSADAPHAHGEDCYTKTDNCKHTHDDTCGYTPDSPCTFDLESCTQCSPGDKPAEKICTCEPAIDVSNAGHDEGCPLYTKPVCTCLPVDSGTQIHGKDCPLYTAPELSEAVKALIAMVDALPNAADITEENREVTLTDFDAAQTAYEALSDADKAVFEATVQYKKLMALQAVLYPRVLMTTDTTWDISKGTLTLTNACTPDCTHTVTGTSAGGTIIVKSSTHNVTLDGVTIDVSDTMRTCAFEITGGATVNLTLAGTNTLKSGDERAGLQVTEGNTLTVTSSSTGSLGATGGTYSAGIGGGWKNAGGTITVSGGTISATGGVAGAGIGGGWNGAGGTITISDHAVVFTAKGTNAPNHIGEGLTGTSGTVNRNSGIIFEGTSGLLYGTSVTPTSSFTIPSTHLLKIESGKTLTISSGITAANNGTVINEGSILGTITGNQPVSPNLPTHDIGTGHLMLDNTCSGGTCKGHTVSGTSTGGKIIVESGTHNVTLDNVTIDVSGTGNDCAFEITGGATVSLTLTSTNVLKSGGNRAGLQVTEGNTLAITEASTGSLGATGGQYGAGIGGGDNGAGGSITISGGTISAIGGYGGAGIGGGNNGAGGSITISGGTVTATSGNLSAGIGGGNNGAGGTITVSGGTVTATSGNLSAGIGGGNNGAGGTITISGGTVTATGGTYSAGIGGGDRGAGGTITISDHAVVFTAKGSNAPNHIGEGFTGASGTVNRNGGIIFEGTSGLLYGTSVTPTSSFTIPSTHQLRIESGKTLTISSGITVANNGIIINRGSISGTITGNQPIDPNSVIHDIGTGDLTLYNTCTPNCTHTVTGTSTGGKIIVKSGTHNVTLDNVTIDVRGACAFEITGGSTVNLTLTGTNVLKSGGNRAGLQVTEGNTLAITEASTGSLGATGGYGGAGIGGGNGGAGGTITVSGGTVTATGGQYGAGIGGGNNGAGGTITVNGGTVNATGGYGGAGIGGDNGGAGGTITVSGGTVNATGGYDGAGIGGDNGGAGGTITVSGGTVTATGGRYGAGIGGGNTGAGGSITVSGGTVTATGGNGGAGIGGGWNGAGGTITISGGTVTATGGNDGAGIGGGWNGAGGTITISDHAVVFTAKGSVAPNHIGEGLSGTPGTVNRNGGIIFEGTSGLLYGTSVAPTNSFTIPSNHLLEIGFGQTLTINSGITATNNGIIINRGSISGTITGNQPSDPNPTTHDIGTGSLILDSTCSGGTCQGHTVNGTSTGGTIIVESGTHNVTLDGVTIDVSGTKSACAFEITGGATVNLTLEGTNTLKSGFNRAGLEAKSGNTLTVTSASTGSLGATGGGSGGAGIGGGNRGAGGTITVSGGTVTATGGEYGAGIGGGIQGAGGTIDISGGTVTANGGYNGAGIGGGQLDAGGTITISGGTVTATGGEYGAGIGGGYNGAGGTITISGGTVTATGGEYGAGIGGGYNGAGGIITVSGGTVTATGGSGGAGIGGGINGAGGTITISGGTVTATGGEYGAGIGGGYRGAGGTVKIDGNTVVYAQKGTDAPNHIGEGFDGTPGTVTKDQGIIFEGESGKVYGDSVTLGADTTIPAGKTLTIDNGTSFLISPDTTLTNNGTLNGTGFVSLLRASSRVDGSGTGNTTHVKKLLAEDTTTIANTSYGTPPAVTWDGVALTANTDFTVSGITAGASVPVTVTGVGDYHGSVTKNIAVDAGSGGGSSGGDSGGGSGGGNTPIITPPASTKPNPPTTVESNVNSKTDKDGNATATVADKDITNAIDKAQKEAKKNGTEANGIAITLNVKTDKNASALGVTLPQKSVSALIAANVTQVTVNNGLSTITLDLAALNALKGGDVVLSVSKMDVKTLSAEAQNAIAGRPVFHFGTTVGGKTVTDFKDGRVGLQMPYTRTTTEQVGNLCAVYIATGGADGNGKVNWLENSSYDPITGMMLASTSHFSIYGVGYKQSIPKFTDVGTHWAKNDIDFVVARGLLTGTSNTTFAPETSMTRGMFVTALGRLAGVDTKKFENTKFTDVKTDAYYAPYVAWASANNIVNGTSDTTFSPDKAISRQEMAVMLVNYSKTIGYKLPSVHAQVTFTDASSIASWAKDAVGQMQMAGILMGKSGNKFDPTATATRAEVSAMLRRYVELVVSTETAEGWAMNESGQWMYIQDGKRITGKKSIDGTAYTFDQYGVTTALPPERKYLIYTVQAGESFWSIAQKYKVSMFELAKVNGKTIFSIIYTGEVLEVPQHK